MSNRARLRHAALPLLASLLLFTVPCAAQAADSPTGCDSLVQAAATGLAAEMKADDATITQPQSVTNFTCLSNFFNGSGLNVILSGFSIASIAQAAMGKICSQLTTAWQGVESAAHCGLTVAGLDTNFNLGLGAGSFCPSINLGSGGQNLITAGTSTTGATNWDVPGTTQLPNGYSLSLIGNGSGPAMSTLSQ